MFWHLFVCVVCFVCVAVSCQNFEESCERNHGLDYVSLKENLLLGYYASKRFSGEDISLVVGETGCGKSTLVGYLIGCPMKFKRDKGLNVVVIDNSTKGICPEGKLPEIGHSTVFSRTPHPDMFLSSNSSYQEVLVDCPGTNIERRITIAFTTDFAIKKSAKSIKAIIITIDYQTLVSKNGFSRIANLLTKLFRNIGEVEDSLIFAITKTELANTNKEYIIELLKEKKTEIEGKATNIINMIKSSISNFFTKAEEKNKEEIGGQLKILDLMLANKDNIVAVNMKTDESREDVFSLIKQSKEIPKEYLKLKHFSEHGRKFKQWISSFVVEEGSRIKRILFSKDEILRKKEEIFEQKKEEKRINKTLSEFVSKKRNASQKIITKESSKKEILQSIDNLNRKIDSFNKRLDLVGLLINETKKNISLIDTNEDVLVWEEIFEEKRWFVTLMGNEMKWPFGRSTHRFIYQGPPISKTMHWFNKSNGVLEVVDQSRFHYEANYISNRGEDGVCSCEIYSKMRDIPENQEEIRYLMETLEVLLERSSQIRLEIEQMNFEVLSLTSYIRRLEHMKELKEVLNFEIKTFEEMKKRITSKIEKNYEFIKELSMKIESEVEKVRNSHNDYKEIIELAEFTSLNEKRKFVEFKSLVEQIDDVFKQE